MTQKQEVLKLLQRRSKKGVKCYEFYTLLGILRYGAHIFKLRQEGYKIKMVEGKRIRGNRNVTYFIK